MLLIRSRRVLAAVLLGVSCWLVSCDGGGEGTEETAFRIVRGACGRVVLEEKIAADSASAMKTLEGRKRIQLDQWCSEPSCFDFALEPFPLQVVDDHGIAPSARFYALRVRDLNTGHLVHSPSEVITTEGELFYLEWCLD